MATHYLSRAEVAALLGIKSGTLSRYALPEPDVTVGSVRGWRESTIRAWDEARPGSPVPNTPGRAAPRP